MTSIPKISYTIGIEVLVNLVLPYLIYIQTEAHIGQVHALLASSLPPILWSGVEFARRRRIDAMSLLVLAGIALSLLAFLGGGSVRFLQLREKLITGLIGLVFLGSAAIGRPLIYQLARAGMMRKSPSEAARLEGLRDNRDVSPQHDNHDAGVGMRAACRVRHRLRAGLSHVHREFSDRKPHSRLRSDRRLGALECLVCPANQTAWRSRARRRRSGLTINASRLKDSAR